MTLQESNEIIEDINRFLDLVNDNIGVLRADKFINGDEISIKIINNYPEENNVADFLYHKIHRMLIKNPNNRKLFHIGSCGRSFNGILEEINFTVTYKKTNNSLVIKDLINTLYYIVNEAKVEFGFHIEEIFQREIPNEIFEQLDVWNDGWIQDGEEDKCTPPENLITYGFKKDWLYSITLGYYNIDLSLLESDVVPELIGVILDSIEDFCYVTSYEHKDWVYIYSSVKFDEDNVFDIEESLFDLLGIISPSREKWNISLEDYYSIINNEEEIK